MRTINTKHRRKNKIVVSIRQDCMVESNNHLMDRGLVETSEKHTPSPGPKAQLGAKRTAIAESHLNIHTCSAGVGDRSASGGAIRREGTELPVKWENATLAVCDRGGLDLGSRTRRRAPWLDMKHCGTAADEKVLGCIASFSLPLPRPVCKVGRVRDDDIAGCRHIWPSRAAFFSSCR